MIGTDSPMADVELLAFADQLLRELGIAEGVTLQLNTLGDPETREAWRAALVEHFEAHRGSLSEESLARLDKNPLRILDSKDPRDRPIADGAPAIDDYLTEGAPRISSPPSFLGWTRQACAGRATRGLSAASITTATRRSNSSRTAWARRVQCWQAGVTTVSSKRSAARTHRLLDGQQASSGSPC